MLFLFTLHVFFVLAIWFGDMFYASPSFHNAMFVGLLYYGLLVPWFLLPATTRLHERLDDSAYLKAVAEENRRKTPAIS